MNRLFIFLSIQHCLHRCERYVVFVDCVVNVIPMFTSILLPLRIVHETGQLDLSRLRKGKIIRADMRAKKSSNTCARVNTHSCMLFPQIKSKAPSLYHANATPLDCVQKCTRNAGCHYNSDVNDFEYFAD